MTNITYSSSVKNELVREQIVSSCCLKAQAYGLVLFSRSFSSRSISFFTENDKIALLYSQNILELTNLKTETKTETESRKKIAVSLGTASERLKLLEFFGHSSNELVLRINRANISNDCCFGAFIRGAFLACGTVTSPAKNYHFEFVVTHRRLCDDLFLILDEMGLSPKYIERNNSHIIYFKDSENIEDILTVMGATNSSLELMGIKMQKDMRNSVNRKVNFEVANITRTIEASRIQISAIEYIESHGGLDSLPKVLIEIATLRKNNPDKSLLDLGKMLKKPISRSGVNHRLCRIVKIAQETES